MAIETRNFAFFSVEEGLHVAISVRDFRAIILHADTLKANITARYTRPCRPLQFSYDLPGMTCEITLMTRGEGTDETESVPPQANAARELSARPIEQPIVSTSAERGASIRLSGREQQQQAQVHKQVQPQSQTQMPPPASQRQGAKPITSLAPVAPIDHESLFVAADDDRQWDEPHYDEEQEDMLRWDANLDQVLIPCVFLIYVIYADLTWYRRHCGRASVGLSKIMYQGWNRFPGKSISMPALRRRTTE